MSSRAWGSAALGTEALGRRHVSLSPHAAGEPSPMAGRS